MPESTTKPAAIVKPKPGAVAWSRPLEEILDICHRADQGDKTALSVVQELLIVPGAADLMGGDLARRAEEVLLDSLCGKQLGTREAVLSKMDDLRKELAGTNPTPVERLLAERAVACWLHLAKLEFAYSLKESMSLALDQHYQKCIDRSHRRYLTSLKTLADVRKLAITLQLNIARKRQVNGARQEESLETLGTKRQACKSEGHAAGSSDRSILSS